jgi:hypothetical protein
MLSVVAKVHIADERAVSSSLSLQGTCSEPVNVLLRHVVSETRWTGHVKPMPEAWGLP